MSSLARGQDGEGCRVFRAQVEANVRVRLDRPTSAGRLPAMLVLERQQGEGFLIDGKIRVVIVRVEGRQVKVGIQAPPEVKIVREELAGGPQPKASTEGGRPGPR